MKSEIVVMKLVNRYIGVSAGYLGLPESNRFTYRTHAEFYSEYCGITKNTSEYEGTTREIFIKIFLTASPQEQAKIIQGSIERFPIEPDAPKSRTESLKKELQEAALTLEAQNYVSNPKLSYTSEVVYESLKDAVELIQNRKAVSAVDRVHTAFYGYLRGICKKEAMNYEEKDDLVVLIKKIFAEHKLLIIKTKASEIKNIARGLASISDSLNPIRNKGSLAHPNEDLLGEPEATLVINSVRTLMIYIESKISK